MSTSRRAVVLGLCLLVLGPAGRASAAADDGEVVVSADRLAAELGSRISRALKVQVQVQPSQLVTPERLIAPATGNQMLLYNPNAMIRLEQTHGLTAVLGVVAHWIGYLKDPGGGGLWAEVQAGCAFARLGYNTEGYKKAVAAGVVGAPAAPITSSRNAALAQGYLSCLTGREPRLPESALRGRKGKRVPLKARAAAAPRLAPVLAPFRSSSSSAPSPLATPARAPASAR